jgi:nitroimidazol reductase NimA-like FMN-containing flavoprotein (pyridoxamine 5'-phosphate oxidase superfamily)
MFRELLRKKQQLAEAECIAILKTETRGVLSVNGDDGYPYGMPMNHFYNETDGCIYFHCGKTGHRVDALKKNDKVSFCVYNHGYRNEGEWALNVKSVIVFGKVEMIDNPATVADITAKLSRKFTNDEEYIKKEIASSLSRTLLLRLIPTHTCGKKVNEA